ncbi:hypothetical protein E2562_020604 [Oryza meyeriana var. granulata]|uniref:Uncharacterized protein n=1 Tax=Oryza meyeriana var. granulata TaxID=110450 RepID=A0A6G1DZ31_9ORYZ|nr:hypothetical protein E2562_020604 [Oryza meyeriana var. granulata]
MSGDGSGVYTPPARRSGADGATAHELHQVKEAGGTPVEDGEDEEKLIRNKGSEDERRRATPVAVEDGERHPAHMEGGEGGDPRGEWRM